MKIDWEEIGKLQNWYAFNKSKISKKQLCDKVIPFRDKYNLKDSVALAIVREELTIIGIIQKINEANPAKFWIKHEWAEEYDNFLIDNFECPYCSAWQRRTSRFCPDCGEEIGEYNYV